MVTGDEQELWREQLSALVDGELDDASLVCSAWRENEQVRATWHSYQLIGDVLRSDDLAGSPARDAACLRRIRERLAREPVVLAPVASPAAFPPDEPRRGWWATGAVAAGFVAVAGIYSFMRPLGEPAPTLAQVPPPAVVARADPFPPGVPSQVVPAFMGNEANARLIRDARLDAYLAAHKQFAGSSALPLYVRPAVDSSASEGR
ncbi:MAG TPA: sigma-E factor negative regulatory protein [Caldimonas sp.]|nr:sigma-E factor negative regulatory protein [Caldimonas sp.]